MNDHRQNASKLLTDNVKLAGCAAKIGSTELRQILADLPLTTSPNLIAGFENFEDAAVYKISDEIAIVQTIDFFPPVIDDPYLYGSIAAANALSDVYAMGGTPILALNVLCFPTCDFPVETVQEILRGGESQVRAAGAILAGGHSIQSQEPVYGLSVTGLVHPDKVLTNGGAREYDAIVLCKPIGTGVGLLGMKAGILSADSQAALLKSLTSLNDKTAILAKNFEIHAATDVTGFGLIGHLHEMAKASGLAAQLWTNLVPFLQETMTLAAQGFVPAATYTNRKSFDQFVSYINDVDLATTDLLFDPQTSGGLLFSLTPENAKNLVGNLSQAGIQATVIGVFKAGLRGYVEAVIK